MLSFASWTAWLDQLVYTHSQTFLGSTAVNSKDCGLKECSFILLGSALRQTFHATDCQSHELWWRLTSTQNCRKLKSLESQLNRALHLWFILKNQGNSNFKVEIVQNRIEEHFDDVPSPSAKRLDESGGNPMHTFCGEIRCTNEAFSPYDLPKYQFSYFLFVQILETLSELFPWKSVSGISEITLSPGCRQNISVQLERQNDRKV